MSYKKLRDGITALHSYVQYDDHIQCAIGLFKPDDNRHGVNLA